MMAKLYGMHLVFHGGLCCGIKTIYNMGTNPDESQNSIAKIHRDDRDQNGAPTTSDTRFFHEEAPAESSKARLERYIDYMKRRRPRNIVEVAIVTKSQYSCTSQEKWVPVLEELGFKRVNSCQNSNSGNVVSVFHLNINEEYPGCENLQPLDEDEDDFDNEEEDDYV